jgi:hypothetical protein
MDRYTLALAQGEKQYRAAIEEDRNLLHVFGLGLLSVSGGRLRIVSTRKAQAGKINPWDVMGVSPTVWRWVRPLLVELVHLRRQVSRDDVSAA